MTELLKYLHHLDKDITLAINSFHCSASDWIWTLFSNKEIWFVLYAAIIFFLFRNLGWKKGLIAVVAIALTVLCCDQFSNFTKDFFQRLRPCCDGDMTAGGLNILEGFNPVSYGFFSAHAANAMAVAIGSYLSFRNDTKHNYRIYGICIFCWGLLVGISRIFVGKHFFGDVMVGFAVGILLAWAFASLGGLVMRRIQK